MTIKASIVLIIFKIYESSKKKKRTLLEITHDAFLKVHIEVNS